MLTDYISICDNITVLLPAFLCFGNDILTIFVIQFMELAFSISTQFSHTFIVRCEKDEINLVGVGILKVKEPPSIYILESIATESGVCSSQLPVDVRL